MCLFVESLIPESKPTCTLQSTNNELAAAVLSTVLIFLAISTLTFVIGFMSGIYVGRKFNKESSNGTPQVTAIEHPRQIPFYEDVFSGTANQQEQNVELKENVAYRPSIATPIDVEINN